MVNLYPSWIPSASPDVTLDDALENIDIGGPTMLRAAAKNFPSVTVVVDPADYGWVAQRIAGSGATLEERRHLAYKAFHHVSQYDTAVAGYLSQQAEGGDGPEPAEGLPQELTLSYRRVQELRYGENPHQRGALYVPAEGTTGGIANARQLHGKELSFNNLLDAEAAWSTVTDFDVPAAVVIKHTNPCGLSCHPDQVEAYRRAYSGDTVSAFGGIVGFNRRVSATTAEEMGEVFYEVVVAPGYEPDAPGGTEGQAQPADSGGTGQPEWRVLRPPAHERGAAGTDTRRDRRGPRVMDHVNRTLTQRSRKWRTWHLPGRRPNT